MELLILAALFLFGGDAGGATAPAKPDDWSYSPPWKKVAQGFARKLAWRVYEKAGAEVAEFELAYKTPEGMFSEGGIATLEAATARAKVIAEKGA